jgi:two-component system, NarL family, nitrate/nitrite response regulator NarL
MQCSAKGAGRSVNDNNGNAIRVAVVDDHPMMLSGLVYVFDNEDGFEVVGRGACAQDAVDIALSAMPDLIFLDISMPGDGMEAARAISRRCPAVRIVMLTAHDGEHHVINALNNGASGYLLKGVSCEELVSSARAVHRGECYVSPGFAAKLLKGDPKPAPSARLSGKFVALTVREQQILTFVSYGMSNKDIGEKVGLAEKTVKHHVSSILAKLHVRNRVEAAIIARQCMGRDSLN